MKEIVLTEREQLVYNWKVATSRGDFDKAKEIAKFLKANPVIEPPKPAEEKTEDQPPNAQFRSPAQPSRGRPKSNFEYPTGEFTVKMLVQLWGCSQPTANNFVNDAAQKGTVLFLRNEGHGGRGRPTKIYSLKIVEN